MIKPHNQNNQEDSSPHVVLPTLASTTSVEISSDTPAPIVHQTNGWLTFHTRSYRYWRTLGWW
jgi:hypothetical protein